MARVYKDTTTLKMKYEIQHSELSNGTKEAIYKWLDIQDILLYNPPNDKRFKKHKDTYFKEFFKIVLNVKKGIYNDCYYISVINDLYKKVFKNRR